MSAVSSTLLSSNRLLESLPRKEYERLQPNLHPIHLPRGRVLCEAGDAVQDVYFPLSGVVSLLSSTEVGEVIENGNGGQRRNHGPSSYNARQRNAVQGRNTSAS